MTFLENVIDHAAAEHPRECCGLVVKCVGGKKVRLERAANLSPKPRQHFLIDPDAWLRVQDGEEVIGIYHSHTIEPAKPSMADLAMCEATNVPWHIVSYPEPGYVRIEPSGYEAPYLERPYVWGVHDCYALLRDWYRREWGLLLRDYDRRPLIEGRNLFVECFEAEGFVRLPDGAEPQVGDAMLFRFGQASFAHCALYVGNNEILHHPEGRLSYREVYAGVWRQNCTHLLRHRSRAEVSHG